MKLVFSYLTRALAAAFANYVKPTADSVEGKKGLALIPESGGIKFSF